MQIVDHVEIAGTGVSRQVLVLDSQSFALLAEVQSDGNGRVQTEVPDGTDSVFLVVMDEPGAPFLGGKEYHAGQRVMPDPYVGLVFEVFLSGVSGPFPPVWPEQVGGYVVSGTVTFKAVPYYRPIAKFKPL